MSDATEIRIRELPTDKLSADHFEMATVAMPQPGPEQVLCETLYLSLDPANRAWMQGATYRSAIEGGQVMAGYTLGRVLESNHPDFAPGDLIEGDGGWRSHFVLKGKHASKVAPRDPLSHILSAYGITSKTAYAGMLAIGKPKAGDTVVVSAAAGATGSVAAQIAKASGARVVGIAGGERKCAWLTDTIGLDAAIDYRNDNLFEAMKRTCPEGIDVYFDNVGGTTLEAALFRMNRLGRIVCCGVVSQYDTGNPSPGPRGVPGLLVTKSLHMQGFLVMDYPELMSKADEDLASWIKGGQLIVAEDIVEGLANAPAGLVGLLAGENIGKRMVRVGSER